ncbi:ZIP family metal transporter [Candidatus Woesearchaeota archaeon]|nr:MAG: ZIP family metal transporter [Candidatus Woesearchaeota archaeon]
MIWLYAILSVLAVSAISFIGAASLFFSAKQAKIVGYLVSFAAGGMLGASILHLLPEAAEEAGSFNHLVAGGVIIGIVASFLFENFLWRHYHSHSGHTEHEHVEPVAYLNLLGDGLHNFLDGLIIGASYLASIPLGISTTLAVVLHEIPQEIGDFGILVSAGFSRAKALFVNFLSALSAIAGAIIALSLQSNANATLYLVPFAAGNFLYISLTDLVPELHHASKTKDAGKHIALFLLGIAIMVALSLIE